MFKFLKQIIRILRRQETNADREDAIEVEWNCPKCGTQLLSDPTPYLCRHLDTAMGMGYGMWNWRGMRSTKIGEGKADYSWGPIFCTPPQKHCPECQEEIRFMADYEETDGLVWISCPVCLTTIYKHDKEPTCLPDACPGCHLPMRYKPFVGVDPGLGDEKTEEASLFNGGLTLFWEYYNPGGMVPVYQCNEMVYDTRGHLHRFAIITRFDNQSRKWSLATWRLLDGAIVDGYFEVDCDEKHRNFKTLREAQIRAQELYNALLMEDFKNAGN